MARHTRLLPLLAVGAIASTGATAALGATSHDARSTARAVALRWSADVPATARMGAEPAATCRQLGRGRSTCPIAILILANDGKARRPWRCSATVVVSPTHGALAARRTNTHCVPFPPTTESPDPTGAFGTAFALQANGHTACLRAGYRRMTCVMRYRRPDATHCIAAASVPIRRLERSVALGAPRCE
jgi:hypothetical protein